MATHSCISNPCPLCYPPLGESMKREILRLTAEIAELREQLKSSNILFTEKVKREIGLVCPDPWRTVLIERIDGIVYEAIKETEKQKGDTSD